MTDTHSPTEHLQAVCAADWAAATRHAFTDALAAGTLSEEQMLAYLQQDYLFLEDFIRLLGATVAHAPSLADALPAAQFLGAIAGPENTYFQRAITVLGADPHAAIMPHPVTAKFQALMRSAARSARYEQMLAVLVVAEWIYLDWAQPHVAHAADLPFWLGEWISLHSGPEFEAVVVYLRGQLDAAWPALDPKARATVTDRFTAATRLERAFFDAACTGFSTA